jgi:hypothetical protein
VGTASGRLDALVFMVGLLLGIFGFAEIYPVISNLVWTGALEVQTLPELFNLPPWILGLAVAAMALGLFWVSAVVERKFSSGAPE